MIGRWRHSGLRAGRHLPLQHVIVLARCQAAGGLRARAQAQHVQRPREGAAHARSATCIPCKDGLPLRWAPTAASRAEAAVSLWLSGCVWRCRDSGYYLAVNLHVTIGARRASSKGVAPYRQVDLHSPPL